MLDKFVLIGRNSKKLSALSAEMAAKNSNVELVTLTVDFADADYEQIESQLKHMDIGILMNFVGVSYPLPQLLHELDKTYDDLSWEHMNVNLLSATNMTRIVLPGRHHNCSDQFFINKIEVASDISFSKSEIYVIPGARTL